LTLADRSGLPSNRYVHRVVEMMLSPKIGIGGTARSKKRQLSQVLLPLVVSILIGALTIHFSNALRVSGISKPFRSRQRTIRLAASSPTIEWIPTRVEFEGVYRSYGPPTMWRKLTSSVPRREFALEDVSLAFGKTDTNCSNKNEEAVCLLLGASSSGKSTIFRSLLEAAHVNEKDKEFGRAENKGRVEIKSKINAKPILLDDRGEVNTSSGSQKTTLKEAWSECAMEILETTSKNEANDLVVSLVNFLADEIFDLHPDALLVDLTPSEKYRFCLGKACIESSFGAALSYALPGPIILLDEWMDVETSAVVRKVQPSLHKIVYDLNGVVLSITHKPELYASTLGTIRRITLSGGKLLSDY